MKRKIVIPLISLVAIIIIAIFYIYSIDKNQKAFEVDEEYKAKTIPIDKVKNSLVTVDEEKDSIKKVNKKKQEKEQIKNNAIENNDEVQLNSNNKVEDNKVAEKKPVNNKPNKVNESNNSNKNQVDKIDNTLNVEIKTENPKKYTGHEWIDQKIDKNRDDINDDDLKEGLSIGDKIDDDIVLGFLEDGLTAEEKVDLKEYLEVILTPEEMDEVKVLIGKYGYMLEE